ncbi:hypothetical protein DFAR_2750001 [Desulfarculales bacterium]
MTAPKTLLPKALELANRIARHPQPAARMAKTILRHGAKSSLEHTLGLRDQSVQAGHGHAGALADHDGPDRGQVVRTLTNSGSREA